MFRLANLQARLEIPSSSFWFARQSHRLLVDAWKPLLQPSVWCGEQLAVFEILVEAADVGPFRDLDPHNEASGISMLGANHDSLAQ
jgi:hypothetical protein